MQTKNYVIFSTIIFKYFKRCSRLVPNQLSKAGAYAHNTYNAVCVKGLGRVAASNWVDWSIVHGTVLRDEFDPHSSQ